MILGEVEFNRYQNRARKIGILLSGLSLNRWY